MTVNELLERIDPRVAAGALIGTLVLGLATYYMLAVRPVDLQLEKLKLQLQSLEMDNTRIQREIETQKASMSGANQEIQRLKLFDLRSEAAFDAVLAYRSNVGLIALSEILQRHHITIDTLTPGPIDQTKIIPGANQPGAATAVAGGTTAPSQGGVLHRRYQIYAQGQYQDVQEAFSEFKTLPPALDIDHYDVQYIGNDGSRAKVYFVLGFGFNFLVSNQQLDKFADLASRSLQASPSLAFQFPSNSPYAAQAATGPALPVVPAAPASASTPPGGRISMGLKALMGWLDAPAMAAPAPSKAPVLPTPKPAKSAPPVTLKTYTFSVDKGVTLGRAEPFLPLGKSRLAKVDVKIKPLAPIAKIQAASFPEATLLAVLLSNDGPASALLQFGNDRIRVRPGSLLSGGAEVAGIGRDFVLIRSGGTLHRVGLRAEGAPAATFAPGMVPQAPSLQVPADLRR